MRGEEIEYLRRRSREFMDTAQVQIERGYYGLASLSLEQSLQLLLKAKLLECAGDYPRVHSVRRLLRLLGEVVGGEAAEITASILREYPLELALLEDAYITSRYVPKEFTEEEVRRLAEAVGEVMRRVERIVC